MTRSTSAEADGDPTAVPGVPRPPQEPLDRLQRGRLPVSDPEYLRFTAEAAPRRVPEVVQQWRERQRSSALPSRISPLWHFGGHPAHPQLSRWVTLYIDSSPGRLPDGDWIGTEEHDFTPYKRGRRRYQPRKEPIDGINRWPAGH